MLRSEMPRVPDEVDQNQATKRVGVMPGCRHADGGQQRQTDEPTATPFATIRIGRDQQEGQPPVGRCEKVDLPEVERRGLGDADREWLR